MVLCASELRQYFMILYYEVVSGNTTIQSKIVESLNIFFFKSLK